MTNNIQSVSEKGWLAHMRGRHGPLLTHVVPDPAGSVESSETPTPEEQEGIGTGSYS